MLEINQILQERERKRREKRNEKIRDLKQKLVKLEFKSPEFDEDLIGKRALRLEKLKILRKQIADNYLKLKTTVETMAEFVKTDEKFLGTLNDLNARDAL